MVRGVPRKVHDAARQLPELKLLVVIKVAVERLLEGSRVVQSVDRRERLLYLLDPPPDTHRYVTTELLLDILSRSEMVGMSVGFARYRAVSKSVSSVDE